MIMAWWPGPLKKGHDSAYRHIYDILYGVVTWLRENAEQVNKRAGAQLVPELHVSYFNTPCLARDMLYTYMYQRK